MPQRADALPKHEIALVERWIKEGAVNGWRCSGAPVDGTRARIPAAAGRRNIIPGLRR